jgi:DNA-binding NtrC family response regulator
MPFALQAKLLHALQDGEFTPLGSENSYQSNVWIIAATNHDLKRDIQEEKFRADLYYRLSETTIHIEPLRKRPEDIPYLIKYYGDKYAAEFNRDRPAALGNGMVDRMCQYHWPGNVRELQNVIRRTILLDQDEDLLDSMISARRPRPVEKPTFPSEPVPDIINLLGLNGDEPKLKSLSLKEIGKRTSDFVEKQVISYVLDRTGWNRSRANKILGISYKTLLAKIQELELTPGNPFGGDPDDNSSPLGSVN